MEEVSSDGGLDNNKYSNGANFGHVTPLRNILCFFWSSFLMQRIISVLIEAMWELRLSVPGGDNQRMACYDSIWESKYWYLSYVV